MTQRDLYALANDNPEMLYAYYQSTNAVIEYRNEMAAIQPDQWIRTQLKEKQLRATIRLMRFANGVAFSS
jgi:hypothetical protein